MKQKNEIIRLPREVIPATAATYAQVFAQEPWKEVSRCGKCGGFSDQQPGTNASCQCGGVYDQPAYPQQQTEQYIAAELNRPLAQGYVLAQLRLLDQVQGFGWGYQSDPQSLAEQKYRTPEMRQMVADLLAKSGFFYYVSEVGVVSQTQGQGWGKQLTSRLIETGSQVPLPTAVLRTNENSPMRYIAQSLGMKPVIGLESGNRDQENEARVLFVGRR